MSMYTTPEHLLTNYPRHNQVRLAQAELFLEFCSYAGIDAYGAESDPCWPGQEGLWCRNIPNRFDKTSAWKWAEQVPNDPQDPFFNEGHSYV